MAAGNDVVRSQSPTTDVTTETLPFDLIPEILCRLPVKLLLQLKCVCKSWKSLISDPKFAKKHLHMSTACRDHHHLILTGKDSLFWDSTISSLFTDASTVPQLQLICPDAINNRYGLNTFSSSCDGILLFPFYNHSALLWNPSIRTFKILPPLTDIGPTDFAYNEDSDDFYDYQGFDVEYAFGYDHFIDNYKVFVTSRTRPNIISVYVYTFGADSWRNIDDFPNTGPIYPPGVFVSGTVNWLAHDAHLDFLPVLVSLDLEKESYRKFSVPDSDKDYTASLGVLRDCLCIFSNGYKFIDVWVMKEYGIQESWTKLFTVPHMGVPRSYYLEVVYVFEDDQVLLNFDDFEEGPKCDSKLIIYNSTNGTFHKIPNMNDWIYSQVYVESLISPRS